MTSRQRVYSILGIMVLATYLILYSQDVENFIANLTRGPIPPPMISEEKIQQATAAATSNLVLSFTEDEKEIINNLIKGVNLKPEENNIGTAMALDGEARTLRAQQRDKEAYEKYLKVLAISYQAKEFRGLSISLSQLSGIQDRGGNHDLAETLMLMAYRITVQEGNPLEIGLMEMGMADFADTDAEKRIWYLKARKSLTNTPYTQDYLNLLVRLSKVVNPENRSSYLDEAYKFYPKVGNDASSLPIKRGFLHDYSSYLIEVKKDYSQALKVLEESERIWEEKDRQHSGYAWSLTLRGKAQEALNQTAEAEKSYANSYALFEAARANTLGEKARISLDNKFRSLVNNYVTFLIKQKQFIKALTIFENNKARSLSDIMGDPKTKELYGEIRQLQDKQNQEMAAFFEKNLSEVDPLAREKAAKEMKDMTQRMKAEIMDLRSKVGIRSLAQAKPISEEQLQSALNQLPDDAAVVSYYFLNDESWAFVASPGKVQVLPIPGQPIYFHRKIQELRLALETPSSKLHLPPAQWLYKNLWAPVEALLPKKTSTIILGSDVKWVRVPIVAFHDGKRFLAEKYAFQQTPSLAFVGAQPKLANDSSGAGLACVDPNIENARLPFQKETGKTLSALYKKQLTLLSDEKCSPKNLEEGIRSLPPKSFLHIGAHGKFDPWDPLDSSILLSADTETRNPSTAQSLSTRGSSWTAIDMATVDMKNIDLVSLSSCETGMSDEKLERDIYGIVRALMFAGAKNVLAPIWSVHDKSTHLLTSSFFSAYAKKTSAPLALALAQREMIKGKEFSHPHYWAAFQLTGAVR